jgi:predicted small lipoprotein YifL
MNKLRTLLLFTLVLAALAACGQRGPLYLPDSDSVPAKVEPPTEEEDDDDGA